MSPEAAIYDFITNQAAITTRVSTRIFPNSIPQSNTVFPVLVFTQISGPHDHTLSGAAGVFRARFQFDCWSTDYSDCINLAEDIRDSFQGYQGAMGTVTCQFALLDNELSSYTPPTDGSDAGLHRKTLDYIIRLEEPQPGA
jgi:hypothetical protein